ncbi:MAG: hypothetical protein ABI647_24265 [Gemmatimonadota bacterium]
MATPIAEYYRFEFSNAADQGLAAARLLQFLRVRDELQQDGPDRAVVWTTRLFAPNPAIYLSASAARAVFLASVMTRSATRVPAEELPKGLVLVFGHDGDRAGVTAQ